ncbi:efflux RND transporter periplasmic adaptor subunit [Pseudodesulfovibrio sp. JC047]|uniref:efflux RND transporter periplasmic adaptor subunit n=1 Tax=Pseudodesulfovibrio sp. JC047 TaxID=2683199 RepID=UPI0013D8D6A1|nr:efflux RND transporter periplasmic adaptor subunit [Pseudodesulfovibrio sp. JC047]NDV20443.1 efflux RND transporter periplasmic adaptor subunit [Pseudodesulfovibrio sp. JC047]
MMYRFFMSAVLCAVALVTAGCNDTPTEAKMIESKAIRVATKVVEPVTLIDRINLPGATEPDEDVCVSSESPGTVIWLGVEEGDRVKKNALIARQDVSSSGARFDQAKATKKLVTEQLRRRRELLKKGVLAKEEFDRMEAELAKSEASLREMQVSVEYGVVRAPVSGIINHLYVDRGERVNAGDKIVDIVDPSVIRTTVNVPEMDIPYIKKGQEVTVTVDAIPGRVWKGIVEFISFKADNASKTFETRVITDNPDGAIRAGMLARVSLERRVLKNTVTTPLYAIINQGGERLVYVEEDGVARARTIELGVIEGERAQVVKGLSLGEKQIVSGHTLVEDGTKVNAQ